MRDRHLSNTRAAPEKSPQVESAVRVPHPRLGYGSALGPGSAGGGRGGARGRAARMGPARSRAHFFKRVRCRAKLGRNSRAAVAGQIQKRLAIPEIVSNARVVARTQIAIRLRVGRAHARFWNGPPALGFRAGDAGPASTQTQPITRGAGRERRSSGAPLFGGRRSSAARALGSRARAPLGCLSPGSARRWSSAARAPLFARVAAVRKAPPGRRCGADRATARRRMARLHNCLRRPPLDRIIDTRGRATKRGPRGPRGPPA